MFQKVSTRRSTRFFYKGSHKASTQGSARFLLRLERLSHTGSKRAPRSYNKQVCVVLKLNVNPNHTSHGEARLTVSRVSGKHLRVGILSSTVEPQTQL